MSKHDLERFLAEATQQIAADYRWIQNWATEDPGTAGEQGQENWAQVLRKWLPPSYRIVTNGRLIGPDGKRSPQVDVIVLHPAYPAGLLEVKHYLAGGVLAVFECKTTLRKHHLPKIFNTCATIKQMFQPRTGKFPDELTSPIFYGVLAHSSGFTSPKSKPNKGFGTLDKLILDTDRELVKHPRLRPDLFCVADLASWGAGYFPIVGVRMGESIHHMTADDVITLYTYYKGFFDAAVSREQFAIGNAILYLLSRLSELDSGLQRLSDYFVQSNIQTPAGGLVRDWGPFEFSAGLMEHSLATKREILPPKI